MSELEEKVLMLSYSLSMFPGLCSEEMRKQIGWLKLYSVFGIDTWLHQGVRKGYIRDKVAEDGKTLIYYCTSKGKNEYLKNFQ